MIYVNLNIYTRFGNNNYLSTLLIFKIIYMIKPTFHILDHIINNNKQ
jgi:hypothetical protein